MYYKLNLRAWAWQHPPLPELKFILLWEGLVCKVQLPTGSNKEV